MPEDTPTPETPEPEAEGTDTTPEPEAPAKTFTQEDLDRIVQQRLAREREKYADYDSLKAKAAEAESETERLIREAREQAATEVKTQYQTRALRDAARAAAAGKWVNADQAVKLVDLADLDPDADTFDTDVQERLDAYLADNPHLAVPTTTPSGHNDAGSRTDSIKPSQLTRQDLSNLTPQQIETARKEGRLDEMLGSKH